MALCTESNIIVRYAETDRMGVVYHANYLVWMEVGRTDYLARVGFPYSKLEQDGVMFPTSDASLRIIRPSYYEDKLVVLTRLARLQSRKVVFKYEIMHNSELMVSGFTEHICVDSQMKVQTLPQQLFDILAAAMKEGDENLIQGG
ncbi:MAG TPA: thioesterase family protein [archaeon]|nr:thioesterase family protein [archaeon]